MRRGPPRKEAPLSLTSGRRFGIGLVAMKIAPIIPVAKREVVESPEWVYELKLDGFRGTVDRRAGEPVDVARGKPERVRLG
jgi:ATP-dependent DNA ligase